MAINPAGCAAVPGSVLLLAGRGRMGEAVGGCSASVQGSLVSGVVLAHSHDAMPHHMNIYERKLLQLRRFISSGKSCGAAQEVIVSHAVLDVVGFQPNPADSVCHLPTSAACVFTAEQDSKMV